MQKSPQPDDIVLLCHHVAFRRRNSIVKSTSWCQVETVTLAIHSSSFIQAVAGYKCWKLSLILVSWSLLSEAVTSVIWCCNQWSTSPYHGSWNSILLSCQISKFHGHLCKVKALPSLRQLDQLRFLQLTISPSRILWGYLFLHARECWSLLNHS